MATLDLTDEQVRAVFEALWEFTEKRDVPHPILHDAAKAVRDRVIALLRSRVRGGDARG